MKPITEKKILKVYISLIENVDARTKTYKLLSNVLLGIVLLALYSIHLNYTEDFYSKGQLAGVAFITGIFLAAAIYLSQMGLQAKFITKYLSKSEMVERINEINT